MIDNETRDIISKCKIKSMSEMFVRFGQTDYSAADKKELDILFEIEKQKEIHRINEAYIEKLVNGEKISHNDIACIYRIYGNPEQRKLFSDIPITNDDLPPIISANLLKQKNDNNSSNSSNNKHATKDIRRRRKAR
jgi:hypothetical protein